MLVYPVDVVARSGAQGVRHAYEPYLPDGGIFAWMLKATGQENLKMASTSTAALSARSTSPRPFERRQTPDYSVWAFEELQALAIQLRIRDAQLKTRNELIELLAGSL